MKTRAQIYGQEAAGLLRIISMYPGLSAEQLSRFYPEKKEKVPTILKNLRKQGRIAVNTSDLYVTEGNGEDGLLQGLDKAVWILLDFMEKVEFHSKGDFPVQIVFFAGGELYEIVCVEEGKEALITHMLNQNKEGSGKRIILVERPEQIAQLDIAQASGYCTVNAGGRIQYYQRS